MLLIKKTHQDHYQRDVGIRRELTNSFFDSQFFLCLPDFSDRFNGDGTVNADAWYETRKVTIAAFLQMHNRKHAHNKSLDKL